MFTRLKAALGTQWRRDFVAQQFVTYDQGINKSSIVSLSRGQLRPSAAAYWIVWFAIKRWITYGGNGRWFATAKGHRQFEEWLN